MAGSAGYYGRCFPLHFCLLMSDGITCDGSTVIEVLMFENYHYTQCRTTYFVCIIQLAIAGVQA